MPADYVRAVERAGGRALLVPPSDDGVDETLDALDGIVFSGGSDLDPETYGHERHQASGRGSSRSATAPSSRCCRPRSRATCPCWRSAEARSCSTLGSEVTWSSTCPR